MVMSNSKNVHVFNFMILPKSQKYDARETYAFHLTRCYIFALCRNAEGTIKCHY